MPVSATRGQVGIHQRLYMFPSEHCRPRRQRIFPGFLSLSASQITSHLNFLNEIFHSLPVPTL